MNEEYGVPHETVQRIVGAVQDGATVGDAIAAEVSRTPYDITPIMNLWQQQMAASDAVWWAIKTRGWTPEQFKKHDWIVSRRKYWQKLRERLYRERKARVEREILAAVGSRHWTWFERLLHDQCD